MKVTILPTNTFYRQNQTQKPKTLQNQTENNSFHLSNCYYPIFFAGRDPLQQSLNNLFKRYSNGVLFNRVNPDFIKRLSKTLHENPKHVLKIGMTGESGSGKSTYASWIETRLKEEHNINFCLIRRDQYMKDYSKEIKKYGDYNTYSKTGDLEGSECVDFDRIVEDINMLASGKAVHPTKRNRNTGIVEPYDYNTTINPSPVIMVEGISLFGNKVFRNFLDISIYADTSDKLISKRWGMRSPQRGKLGETAKECYKVTKEKAQIYTIPYKEASDIVLNTQAKQSVLNQFLDEFVKILTDFRAG